MESILQRYGIGPSQCEITLLKSGLINETWKIVTPGQSFILQRINDHVFRSPEDIASNIRTIAAWLSAQHPDFIFVSPLKSIDNEDIIHDVAGWYRLFPFIEGSHTIQSLSTPEQAFEAAAQFGKLTKNLSSFDLRKLNITIPDFHNLSLRYRQFEVAINHGNVNRINRSRELINKFKDKVHIVQLFESMHKNPAFKKRVMHHDAKVSNVLFDQNDRGICVIDLDTVMPGYFISDFGDMMRTYLSPVTEEESDFSKIEVREDFFGAIAEGYLNHMAELFTEDEMHLMVYAGFMLTYMQGIRFLTDYCNNDIYYGSAYEDQNFIRAGNQFTLLTKLEEKQTLLTGVLKKAI